MSFKRVFTFFIVYFSLLNVAGAFADVSSEMEVLKLYYTSKDLVFSSTRSIKPVSQAAENITVITAEDIRVMNAHTVADVLNQVPGLFLDFNRDFGMSTNIHMQGSNDYHTTVLLDGIRWNFLAERNVATNNIPVEIIARIEIIKGPASSVWGSALGGVVNIITRHLDKPDASVGTLSASFGERNTSDLRAGYQGKMSRLKYYLYAGRQETDGLRGKREFECGSFYSKASLPVFKDGNLEFSVGYTEPEERFFSAPSYDMEQYGKFKTLFGNSTLNADIFDTVQLDFSFHFLYRKMRLPSYFLSSPGELIDEIADEERLLGGSGTLSWMKENHTVILGMDANSGDLDAITHNGPFYQSFGDPATDITKVEDDEWAVFFNDTLLFSKWAFTPGIRYDHNRIYGSFVSPSLGVTYEVGGGTVIRGNIAKGFTAPLLADSSVGGWWVDPNPDLDPEEVWSYQLGAESRPLDAVWLKTTLFYHRLEEAFNYELQPSGNYMAVNEGTSKRRGMEAEVLAGSWRNMSVGGGISFVQSSPPEENGWSNIYAYHVKLAYEDGGNTHANLYGQYIQGLWDADEFIWDFSLLKRLFSSGNSDTFFTFAAHNLFNGAQYANPVFKNPKRWLEAGIRMEFK